MKRNRLLFIPIQPLPLSMHHKWEHMIDFVWKTSNEISEDLLPTKSLTKINGYIYNLFVNSPLKGIKCHYTSQTKENLEVATLSAHANWEQCPGRFLGTVGRDPSVSTSNRLHVDTFRFFFISLGYIL